MNYTANIIAISIFAGFVAFVLGLSFYYARRTQSSEGYFAAGGTIHWAVNGIAFAGDYLSAASFLGICGMIAFYGYDGFLYSIGYLAGWIVALFVVAEPMKRLGKYTFTDALDSKFNSKSIQLTAAISTLVVSLFYLIPQMVGAGVLVTPLLGLAHHWGVIMVGAIVIFIVATAGMTSTTYVQFLKGGLLIVFSLLLSGALLRQGLSVKPDANFHEPQTISAVMAGDALVDIESNQYRLVGQYDAAGRTFAKLDNAGMQTWWLLESSSAGSILKEAQAVTKTAAGDTLYNGAPKADGKFYAVGNIAELPDGQTETGPLSPAGFFRTISNSKIVRYHKASLTDAGDSVAVYYPVITSGSELMRPGEKFKVDSDKGATPMSKLNFISLMLALFFGTAALPHILIRYYTVPSQRDARKSTIVAIVAIGFFYVLTLFMGLGAMVSGVLDVENNNMSAPLLAQHFGIVLFSIISAVAFATVLGTVSGLIVAASGAVAHDLMGSFFKVKMTDKGKVVAGKTAAVVVGVIAIGLGIAFKGMNVSFLVGWAFAVAASANLPAILMLLFWKKTTAAGIASSIVVGMVSAMAIILVSPSMYAQYGLNPSSALLGLDNPGIISIPLSFATVVVVSLLTQPAMANATTIRPAIEGA